MKAIVHTGMAGLKGLSYKEADERQPGLGEVKVKLKAAGLNHRDLFIMEDRSTGDAPLVIGSDGAGRIEAVGEGVLNLTIGEDVIINPCIGWERSNEVPVVPEILGGPAAGTLAQYVIIPSDNVYRKPKYLSWEEAGVLPLSALTAYRALFTRGHLQQGEHVLIPGIGGGVATYAMLMALAAGARVSVTSRTESKLQAALTYGVDFAFDSQSNWTDYIGSASIDLVLDSIGPATFRQYFNIIKPNGRIVTFGASSGDNIDIPIRDIFFPQISIIGTSMGSSQEFAEMLEFMEDHAIHPIIDKVFSLQDTTLAFERMKRGEQLGNIGIRID